MGVQWHSDHKEEMIQRFDTFASSCNANEDPDDADVGWDPKANSNTIKGYFELVTNDTSSAFGKIPNGRTQKITLNVFKTHFKNVKNEWLETNTYPQNPRGGAITSTQVAARNSSTQDAGGLTNSQISTTAHKIMEEDKNPKNNQNNFLDDDVESMDTTTITIATAQNGMEVPIIQSFYSLRTEGGGQEQNNRLSIFLHSPSGWMLRDEKDFATFFQLSEDKKSITLSFEASRFMVDPEYAQFLLLQHPALAAIYAPNERSGVLHPAVTGLLDTIERHYNLDERVTFTFPLIKPCSSLVSIEGLNKDDKSLKKKLSKLPYLQSVHQLLFKKDRNTEVPKMTGILHIELSVDDATKRFSRSIIPQDSRNSSSQSPRGGHSWNGSSSFSSGGRSRSHGHSGAGNRHGGNGSQSRNNTRAASFSPPPAGRSASLATKTKKNRSLSPTPRVGNKWTQYRRRDPSEDEDSDEDSEDELTENGIDPPAAPSPDLDETASSSDMARLNRGLGNFDVERDEQAGAGGAKLESVARRLGALEMSHSKVKAKVDVIHELLMISKNDDGEESSKLLDSLDRRISMLSDRISNSVSHCDANSRTLYDPLVTSIKQLGESMKTLRTQVSDQIMLKHQLESLADRIERVEGGHCDLPSLKTSLDDCKKSISDVQLNLEKQRNEIEAKLTHWNEAGNVVLGDVSAIKERQKELESMLVRRGENLDGLMGAINHISPIKVYN